MKGKLLRIGIALVAMSSCLALAQDRNHRHTSQHRHTTHHKRVYVTTQSHTRRVRGGTQTITYYNYHNMRTGGQRRSRAVYDKARPWYHPRTQYSQSEWQARVRAAQRNRNRRHHTTWSSAVVRSGNRRHHTSWSDAVVRSGRRRTRTVYVRRHDNGLHRGWSIGRGNPHRIGWHDADKDDRQDRHHRNNKRHDRKHDEDRDHDGDNDHGHGHPMAFASSGFQLASWQNGYQNRQYQDGQRYQRRRGSNRRNYDRRRAYAAGHYTSVSRWSRRGEEFVIRYIINLGGDGHARLEATSLQDRNMPNNNRNTDQHGDILKYMHSGHDVIQTGSWNQDGNNLTIRLNRMQTGQTVRTKNETLRGHLSGNTLVVDSFDRNFYGDRFDVTFQRD